MQQQYYFGVLILSVAVALFRSFGGTGAHIISEIEKNKIAEFNNQFLKYYEQDGMTAHDVVTLANLAHKNNIQYEVENQNMYSNSSLYIQISVDKEKNFEKLSEDNLISFLKQNSEQSDEEGNVINDYYIKHVEISTYTQRVIYVEIRKKTS